MVSPGLDSSFCTVRSLVAGRDELELNVALSEMRLECRRCFVVKDNVADGVAKVGKERKGRSVRKDIRFC